MNGPPATGATTLTYIGLFVISLVIFAVLLFVPAGRLNWTAGWVCLIVMQVGFTLVTAHALRRTPSLLKRRSRAGAGTPLWDKILVSILQLCFMAILILGGLDARHYWTRLPLSLQATGFVMLVFSMFLFGWAMGQNPHFESTVRIQTDQMHRVIDSGPYKLVRHPGYVAGILLMTGMALLLGSAVALIPALICTLDLIVRTALEDHFLRNNLPGYREFAQRTRYRLVPGLW